MAWQRTIPFGYRMEQAELVCEKTEAETVKRIYSLYLAGHSLKRIAEAMMEQGVQYHKDKPSWNKSMVKRILDNEKYLGDGEYPRIICDEDFLAAQLFKENNNRYTPSQAQIVSIKGKLVCGACGERMTRLSPRKGIVKWKCRNPSCQCSVRLSDDELIVKLDDCFNVIMQKPELLEKCVASAPPAQSDVMRLENELAVAFNRGVENAEYMKTLIFAVAAEKYKQLPDNALCRKVEAIRAKIESQELTDQLKQELMDTVVQGIKIGSGSTVAMQLINGKLVISKEESQ